MEHNKQTPIFPILDVHTLLVNKKKANSVVRFSKQR